MSFSISNSRPGSRRCSIQDSVEMIPVPTGDMVELPIENFNPRHNLIEDGGGGHKSHSRNSSLGRKDQPSPSFLQKIIFGFASSFGFNVLIVTNGTIIDWYEEVYHLQNKLLSLADFMIGIFAVYALILFGFMSDRTKTRFGRRKPFVVLLAPILAISVGALYNPGFDGGRSDLISGWFVMCCFVMQLTMYGLTVVIAAWGSGLTKSNEERASLYTIDAVIDLLGFGVGVVLTSTCSLSVCGALLTAIILVQNFMLVSFVPNEPPSTKQSSIPFVAGLNLSLRNPQFVILLLATTFGSIINSTVSLLPFFFRFVLQVPQHRVEIVYSVYARTAVAVAFVTIFAVQVLNKKFGKVAMVRFAILVGVLYGLLAFGLSYTTLQLYNLTTIPAGIFSGIMMVNGNVLLSDTIDYDELLTGHRRASMYQCLLYVPFTFFSVAGSSIPLYIISITEKGGEVQANGMDVVILRFWMSLVVSISLMVCYWFMRYYKITESVHNEIMEQLTKLETGEITRVVDPVLGTVVEDPFMQLNLDTPEGESEGDHRSLLDEGNDYLSLSFGDREMALISSEFGRWRLTFVYVVSTAFYVIYLGIETYQFLSSLQKQNEVATVLHFCLAFIVSISLIYDVCRCGAIKTLHTFRGPDLIKWANEQSQHRKISEEVLTSPMVLLWDYLSFQTSILVAIIALHIIL